MHNLGLERTGHTYLLNGEETLLIPTPTLQSSCTDLMGDRGGGGEGGRLVLCVGHGDVGMVGGGSEWCVAVNLDNDFKPSLPRILLFIILSSDRLRKLLTTPVAKVNSEP